MTIQLIFNLTYKIRFKKNKNKIKKKKKLKKKFLLHSKEIGKQSLEELRLVQPRCWVFSCKEEKQKYKEEIFLKWNCQKWIWDDFLCIPLNNTPLVFSVLVMIRLFVLMFFRDNLCNSTKWNVLHKMLFNLFFLIFFYFNFNFFFNFFFKIFFWFFYLTIF